MGRRGGLPITAEFVKETFGMTNPAMFRRLLGDALTEDQARNFSETKESIYRDIARGKIDLMPGVRDLLGRLREMGFLLAVGTSGIRANIELTIEECGLSGMFAAIASANDITRSKPDPEVFLVAARKAGVEPRRAVGLRGRRRRCPGRQGRRDVRRRRDDPPPSRLALRGRGRFGGRQYGRVRCRSD